MGVQNIITKKIKVLIVDDSVVIRTLLNKMLTSDPEIEVVAMASDPYVAREEMVRCKPDLMTLDVEMPRMDGITFLELVMKHYPTRTVIISSLTNVGAELALKALEVGAVDVIAKPKVDVSKSFYSMKEEIVKRIKAAAKTRIARKFEYKEINPEDRKNLNTEALAETTHQVLAIASSTGGTEALKAVLTKLPPDLPGTLIVQHMPATFTKTYAQALQRICPFEVKEAKNGDRVRPGCALLAPGDFHMELVRNGAFYYVKLHQGATVHGVRPAADITMKSVANIAGANAIGVVLTGMGADGAQGLLEMKKAGSFNIAQDEESCVVFGMPKEAIQVGAIHSVRSLKDIAGEIIHQLNKREKKSAA
jgi:two-component system, chemotaxis family, protein-glutamate methylesterase/glutaminase